MPVARKLVIAILGQYIYGNAMRYGKTIELLKKIVAVIIYKLKIIIN